MYPVMLPEVPDDFSLDLLSDENLFQAADPEIDLTSAHDMDYVIDYLQNFDSSHHSAELDDVSHSDKADDSDGMTARNVVDDDIHAIDAGMTSVASMSSNLTVADRNTYDDELVPNPETLSGPQHPNRIASPASANYVPDPISTSDHAPSTPLSSLDTLSPTPSPVKTSSTCTVIHMWSWDQIVHTFG